MPHEVNLQRLLASGQARVLSKEFTPLVIDFENLPPEAGQHLCEEVLVTAAGRVDLVVFWWTCAMLRGDAWDHRPAGMTNAPDGHGDPDHWRQAVCMLMAPK